MVSIPSTAHGVGELIAATDSVAVPCAERRASRPFGWPLRRSSRSRSSTDHELFVAPTEALLYLEVRPHVFALIWWGMVAIHTFTAVVLTAQAWLYVYLTQPSMSYFVNLVEPDIGAKYTAVAAVFGVLSVFHWRTVFALVSTSLHQRKFAFFPADHYELKPFVKPPKVPTPTTWWSRVCARLTAWRLVLWGRRGLLGVESPYFFPYFYLRECIELTSQIWQAYRGSLLVSRAWINHLSVAIIVVNCLLTPAFQIYYKHRPELRRLAMVSLDAVLDFFTAIVVPLSIFLPYLLDFHPATQSFTLEKTYDETWFVNAVLENQEFLVVSVADLIFKCIPHISITGCLKKVRLLILKDTSVQVGAEKARIYATAVAPSTRCRVAQAKLDRINRHAERRNAERTPNRAIAIVAPMTKTIGKYMRKYASKFVRVAFVAIGCSVLGIHLHGMRTSYRADKVGCKQEMRPWLAPSFACSIVEVNCEQLRITGTELEIRQVLSHLYAPAVAALVFTNCPALEMPTEIQAFQHLLRLDVYNSSINHWDERAALTNAAHSSLATLVLARVQFDGGELPAGLVSWEFPDGLRSVEITTTNLRTLPEDLHERWHHSMTRVLIEHSRLTQIPTTLRYLAIKTLSLEGNAITSLDSAWLADHDHHYLTLALSCNPQLTELPPVLYPGTIIHSIRLHRTNVSAVPDWISDGDHRVFASETPLCDALSHASTNDLDRVVSCAKDDVADDMVRSDCGLFPLSVIDAKRHR
jgi:hypothetical protein